MDRTYASRLNGEEIPSPNVTTQETVAVIVTRSTVPSPKAGEVNYSLIETLKESWRSEGWSDKPRSDQKKAMALMIGIVRNDIQDTADQEATLNYIQRTIDTW